VRSACSSAAKRERFARAPAMIWSRAVNISALDLSALAPSGRGLGGSSCLRTSAAATCVSMRARFRSTPVSSALRRSLCRSVVACSCLRSSRACCSGRACALASSASCCYRSRTIWARVAIPPEVVESELDADPRPTIVAREV
jgi:hypothetical protein